MFKTSHLQELKRRYTSMYAPPVEEKVIEDGTDEGAKKYKKDTPGQDIEKEFKEHCGVCGEQGIEEDEIDEKSKKHPDLAKIEKEIDKFHNQTKHHKYLSGKDAEKMTKLVKKRDAILTKLQPNQSPTWNEDVDLTEGTALQVKMALSDVGLKGTWKNNKVYVKKRDVKKAEKALKGNVIYKGKPPVVVGEEVELEENPYMIKVTKDFKYDGKVVTISKKDFKQVHKDFKNSTRGKERMLINDPKTGGSISVPVQFEEVEIEEQQIDEKGTAYPATVDTLRKIVKDKQHQTVMFKSGQAIVDLFTASAMVQVYDALKKPEMKKTFEKMITDKAGFLKTQAFAMKMIGK